MVTQKYEWRKDEKAIYPTTKQPLIAMIPEQIFITIGGQGDPNQADFSERVAALYAISYAIKMAPKKNVFFPQAFDYTVYPLEGQWTVVSDFTGNIADHKDKLAYTIMIKQPSFVTPAVFEQAKALAKSKVPSDLMNQLKLETMAEGQVGMILHTGSFDTEVDDFERLRNFLKHTGYERVGMDHKEIYLSDFRRVPEEKRKTLLRVKVVAKCSENLKE